MAIKTKERQQAAEQINKDLEARKETVKGTMEKMVKPTKAKAYTKPNSDYHRLDLIKRKKIMGNNSKPIMTEAIETDYKAYINKVKGSRSVTAYIQDLIEADMEQNKTKAKPTQQDKLIEAIKKMDSKQLKAIQGIVEVMGLL